MVSVSASWFFMSFALILRLFNREKTTIWETYVGNLVLGQGFSKIKRDQWHLLLWFVAEVCFFIEIELCLCLLHLLVALVCISMIFSPNWCNNCVAGAPPLRCDYQNSATGNHCSHAFQGHCTNNLILVIIRVQIGANWIIT